VSDMSAVLSALAGLAAQDPHQLTDAELREQLIEIERAARVVEGVRAGRLAVFDARGVGQADNALSTAAWLRHRCQLGHGEAKQRVQTARALRELPQTAAALSAGEVGYRQAAAIGALTADIDLAVVAGAEPELLAAAAVHDPVTLRRALRHVQHRLAPEMVVRDEQDQRQRRGVHLSKSWQGMFRTDGWLTDEVGAMYEAALRARMHPAGPDDTRSSAQRRHDALELLLRDALDSLRLPETNGRKPHLQVTVDLTTLLKMPGAPAADLTWAGPISGEAARRIACDAMVSRIITAGRSQILDVGRTTRVIPLPLRIALEVRDRGCVTDGCTIPAAYCDAHHVVHWLDLGETCLDNCCLLCPRHHTLYHEGRFTIHQRPDGSWETRPPPLLAAA
jgi:hypothetical protein